ncbi:transposase [Desulfosporosinus sp. SYSU MS00001]|uniref:transposase n=1 Tax=Desulfosporosinus sp. SYSU MS00001 TaxID=3416284 RepID=UPI003CF6E965
MPKYDKFEKQDIIDRYYQSEQSVKDFCKTNSVAPSTLYRWLKECKGETQISNPMHSTKVLKDKHDLYRNSTYDFINSNYYQNATKVLNSIRPTLPYDYLENRNRFLINSIYPSCISPIQTAMSSRHLQTISPIQTAMSSRYLETIKPIQPFMSSRCLETISPTPKIQSSTLQDDMKLIQEGIRIFGLNYQEKIRPIQEAMGIISLSLQESIRPIQEAIGTFAQYYQVNIRPMTEALGSISLYFQENIRPIQEAMRLFGTSYQASLYKTMKSFEGPKYNLQKALEEFRHISEEFPDNQLVKGTSNLYQLAKEKTACNEIKDFERAKEEPLIHSLVKILLTEDLTEFKVLNKVEEIYSELSQTTVEGSIVDSVEMLKATVNQSSNTKGIYVETPTRKFIGKVYSEEKTESGLIVYKSIKFLDILHSYSKMVTSQSIFRSFWKSIASKKFKENPEEIGKLNLKTYLITALEQEADILEEVPRGRGEIDIYVIRPNFIPSYYAIEIKVIEKTTYPVKAVIYGDQHKKGAVSQLTDYIKNSPVSEGYLVIFDGYDEDQKPEIPDTINTDHGLIHVVRVDILPGKSQSYI